MTSNFIAAINDKFRRNAMEIYGHKAHLCTDTILPFKLYAYGIKRRMNYCNTKFKPYQFALLDAATVDRSSTGNVARTFPRNFDVLFVFLSR